MSQSEVNASVRNSNKTWCNFGNSFFGWKSFIVMIQLIIGGSFRKRFPFPPDPKLYAVSIVTLIIATFLMMTTSIQSATLDSTSTLSMDIGLNRIIDSSSENSTARNSSSSHYDQIHSSSSHHRSKRGVLQLASMISCVSGCDPLSYKGYGCYCGYGGAGVPVDGIDRYLPYFSFSFLSTSHAKLHNAFALERVSLSLIT